MHLAEKPVLVELEEAVNQYGDEFPLDEGTNNDLMGQPTSMPIRQIGQVKSTTVELEDLVDPANNRVLVHPIPSPNLGYADRNTSLHRSERDDFEGGQKEEEDFENLSLSAIEDNFEE